MEFINTDGMAIFGPGSEWFWTMLQFTALAITFAAIYRQLRAQHLQTRETAKALRSQAHYNALRISNRPYEMLIESQSLSAVVTAGNATPDALDGVSWARYGGFMLMLVDSWEYLYYQDRDGSIPKELWVGADAYFKTLVVTKPGSARFWAEYKVAYDQPFRSYVEHEFAMKAIPSESHAGPTAGGQTASPTGESTPVERSAQSPGGV